MKNSIKKIFNTLGYKISGDIRKADWVYKNGSYVNEEFGLKTTHADSPLIEGFSYVKKIIDQLGGKFFFDNGQLYLQLQDLVFAINDTEELYIIKEVFVEKCYNIGNRNENYVVIDVGLNVGITALSFARLSNIQKVYGFELFPDTYNMALKNIAQNKAGEKVVAQNWGLSDKNVKQELPYVAQNKGRMGINGIPTDMQEKSVKVTVQLHDISETFSNILAESTSYKKICKMDCEGSEYVLLPRLYETEILDKIDIYAIEWHYKNPDPLKEMFEQKGFQTLCTTFSSADSGMLYAFK